MKITFAFRPKAQQEGEEQGIERQLQSVLRYMQTPKLECQLQIFSRYM